MKKLPTVVIAIMCFAPIVALALTPNLNGAFHSNLATYITFAITGIVAYIGTNKFFNEKNSNAVKAGGYWTIVMVVGLLIATKF